jgi:hypothetical protein
MAFPGMAAYRVPDRWMTQGWCSSPGGIQIEDTGGIRIVLAGILAARPRHGDWRSVSPPG